VRDTVDDTPNFESICCAFEDTLNFESMFLVTAPMVDVNSLVERRKFSIAFVLEASEEGVVWSSCRRESMSSSEVLALALVSGSTFVIGSSTFVTGDKGMSTADFPSFRETAVIAFDWSDIVTIVYSFLESLLTMK